MVKLNFRGFQNWVASMFTWLADRQIFISLIALIVFIWSSYDKGLTIDWAYGWVLFWGTFYIYNLHDLVRQKQPARHLLVYIIMALLGLIWMNPSKVNYLILVSVGILSLLYVLPLTKDQKTIRNFGFIKAMIISMAWCLATVGNSIFSGNLIDWHLLGSRFSWILGLTILFDYRDRIQDKSQGILTWGNSFDLTTIKSIHTAFILVAVSLEFLRISFTHLTSMAFFVASLLSTGLVWSRLSPRSPHHFYTIWLDSTLAWPAIISALLSLNIWLW